ncbi:response regulator transcription factor [Oceanirhabdus sp. W0125-5]|uniref:response regulator transcription factor n=1 Tax=Oceanirhabdus sp. W0125-5 TaxID=2999116 RepID=UPI0022F311FC|nr:response regulator transcription factor [Oceanirhabdus sp. W0125-5]WBW99265.1 response regulator transcription factor [Oceanirhabdus sp. W0125-5]
MQKILIIEDEVKILDILYDYFTKEGYEVIRACDGIKGIEAFESNSVDLVILDVMMPKLDGWSVCKRIRKKSAVPIIMLTARNDEEDMLMGFDLKADEYVTKPFSPAVLIARVKMLLKRTEGTVLSESNVLERDGLRINLDSHNVYIDNSEIKLSPKEYDLLVYFIKNSGIALSRDSILNAVWGFDYFGNTRVVDTHVKKLRKAMEHKAYMIQTVFGIGYKFEVE